MKNVQRLENSSKYNDKDYIHYIYKIINKTNGMYYIGIHSFPKDLGYTPLTDGYWGSGTKIQETIKKEGRNNFEKIILKIFSTRQQASDEEKRLVTEKELCNSKCYNSTLGGDDNFISNMGVVVCRPKNAFEKIIKISREEYYKNKHLYVPIGHSRYYVNGPKEKKAKKREYLLRQKQNNSDTLFNRRREFVNKNTLEIKVFVGHDEPDNLYSIWYPSYFYSKNRNMFISMNQFSKLYKETPNIEKLSKFLGHSTASLRKIRDYYVSLGLVLNNSKNLKRRDSISFNGKTFVNKDGSYIVIEKTDLEKYISLGYEPGKFSSLIEEDKVVDFYCLGNSLKKTAKEFKTTVKVVKRKLFIEQNASLVWFHNDFKKVSIRLLVNKDLKSKIQSNGWKEGRKVY